MSEPVNETETTLTETTLTETTATEAPVAEGTTVASEALPFPRRFLADLREAGEQGKKQWEDMLARVFKREETAEAAAEAPAEAASEATVEAEAVVTPFARVRERAQTLLKSEPFTRAQDKGAALLIDLLTRVRRGAEALETSLREARPAQPAGEVEPAAA